VAEARKKRRRRRPEEAEAEIIDAAEALIRTRAWSEVTVERVMAGTTLARETFYVYFSSRHELLIRVLARLREQIDTLGAPWRESAGDVHQAGRSGLRALVLLYKEHGLVLRALSAAAAQDPTAEAAWREFLEAGERRSAQRIREGVQRGEIVDLDPDEAARALCAMNREYLFQTVVGHPDADVDRIADTLHGIWWRTLYGPAARDVT
jgi:TetR/AcrR family transcriptional regulator, ethionamide resistance regulator